jgi:hypothetical protein
VYRFSREYILRGLIHFIIDLVTVIIRGITKYWAERKVQGWSLASLESVSNVIYCD